MWCDNTK